MTQEDFTETKQLRENTPDTAKYHHERTKRGRDGEDRRRDRETGRKGGERKGESRGERMREGARGKGRDKRSASRLMYPARVQRRTDHVF